MIHSRYSSFLLSLVILLHIIQWCHGQSQDRSDQASAQAEKKLAVVTLLTSESYVPGAEVLAQSLILTKTKGDRVLLYISNEEDERSGITEEHLDDLRFSGWDILIPLTRKDGNLLTCDIDKNRETIEYVKEAYKDIEIDFDRYWGTCAKIALWSLIQYDSIIYIDADSIVLKTLDRFFDVIDPSKNVILAAQLAPDCDHLPREKVIQDRDKCQFQTAFLVIAPIRDIFEYLANNIRNMSNQFEGDLPYINTIFQVIYALPDWVSVPQTNTNRPVSIKEGNKFVDWDQVYSYDFTGTSKPWKCYRHQMDAGDIFEHPLLGQMTPSRPNFEIFMPPLLKWYSIYDDILKKKEQRKRSKVLGINKGEL